MIVGMLSSSAISGGVDIPQVLSWSIELSIDLSAQSVPHIIPGVLYPGYDDKQIDGTTGARFPTTSLGGSTVTSNKYGTVQSDGGCTTTTDIKEANLSKTQGSAHIFGSQQHKFRGYGWLSRSRYSWGKCLLSRW